MITDTDRAMWFGASDVKYIIAKNRNTATFKKWWLEKLGYTKSNFSNKYTIAGTNYEHRILDALEVPGLRKDTQVRIENLRLRVNLDGDTETDIFEVKTFKADKKFNSKQYIPQVQVQMFTTGKRNAYIIAYPLEEYDYKNLFNEIDREKILKIPVEYDSDFIEKVFLPNLMYLKECLIKGIMPTKYIAA